MKSIFFTFLIIIFMSNISYADNKCSNFKKLSKEHLKCLGSKLKKKSLGFGLDTSNIKEKKYLTDWFKKKN